MLKTLSNHHSNGFRSQEMRLKLKIVKIMKFKSTEETELIYTCPDERSEKNHVGCLLNISDVTHLNKIKQPKSLSLELDGKKQ